MSLQPCPAPSESESLACFKPVSNFCLGNPAIRSSRMIRRPTGLPEPPQTKEISRPTSIYGNIMYYPQQTHMPRLGGSPACAQISPTHPKRGTFEGGRTARKVAAQDSAIVLHLCRANGTAPMPPACAACRSCLKLLANGRTDLAKSRRAAAAAGASSVGAPRVLSCSSVRSSGTAGLASGIVVTTACEKERLVWNNWSEGEHPDLSTALACILVTSICRSPATRG